MSGSIRRLLGPSKARLQKLIEEKPDFSFPDSGQSKEESLRLLHQMEYDILFNIKRLQKAVDSIQEE